jgi:hypothetical protein
MRKSETRRECDEGSADENPDSKYKERGTVGWCSGTPRICSRLLIYA